MRFVSGNVALEEEAVAASFQIRWRSGWWLWHLIAPSSSFRGATRSRWISGWPDGGRAAPREPYLTEVRWQSTCEG